MARTSHPPLQLRSGSRETLGFGCSASSCEPESRRNFLENEHKELFGGVCPAPPYIFLSHGVSKGCLAVMRGQAPQANSELGPDSGRSSLSN